MLLTCLLGAAIFLGPAASSAPAAEKGVHFDPESPAGKEYALPLSQARNEGAGKRGVSKDDSVEPAPLFGEGVSGPGGPGAEGASRSGDRGHGQGGGNGPGGAKNGESGGGATSQGPSAGPFPADSYSAGTGLLLVAVVLVAALGLGFGLRRLSRPRSV